MTMLGTTEPRRRQPIGRRVPVVLPVVEARVDEDGRLEVFVDHHLYPAASPLTRKDLPRVLGEITERLASPVRVEVHEADGNVFTDIATPDAAIRPRRAVAEETSLHLSPGEVGGVGFAPDEEVAVAVVVAHQVAESDGSTRLRLPPALLADRPGLVVLLGRTSGAIAVSGGIR